MKIYYLLIGFVLLLMYSCNSTDNPKEVSIPPKVILSTMDSSPVLIKNLNLKIRQIDSLESVALEKGDKNAFYTVEAYYEMRKEEGKILTFCILMAHKHNYNFAYYMVYTVLVHQKDNNLKGLDEQTQNFALYYLIRSYELGYKDALYNIEEEFGGNKPIPKSGYYLNKMIEYDSKK